jgi:O-antigen/teichoic acid export membrane protein
MSWRKQKFNVIKSFVGQPFLRDVATVASGTAVAQIITIAFVPLLTRLYGPEAYGIQGVFLSVVTVLGTIVTLSYPIAIVLPKGDAEAWVIAKLSLWIGVIACFAVWIFLNYFENEILDLLKAKAFVSLIPLIPIYLFIFVLGKVINQWAIRKKAFYLVAKVSIKQSLVTNLTKITIGAIYPSGFALVIANSLGLAVAGIFTLLGLRRSASLVDRETSVKHTQHDMFHTAYQYRDFLFFRTPQEFLNVVSQSLPIILLSTYFGPISVGYYSLGLSVLAIPAGLIGASVMQVFYPRINEAIHKKENAQSLIIKTTTILAVIGGLPFFIIIIAGPMLFKYIFGTDWESAGVYAQWLSAWVFFQFINKPAVSAIPALHLQGGLLIYELFSTGTKLLAIYIGFFVFNSDLIAIALFSMFGVVAYAWLIIWVIIRSGNLHGSYMKSDE